MGFREFINESINFRKAIEIISDVETDWEMYGKTLDAAIEKWVKETFKNFDKEEIADMIGIKETDISDFEKVVKDRNFPESAAAYMVAKEVKNLDIDLDDYNGSYAQKLLSWSRDTLNNFSDKENAEMFGVSKDLAKMYLNFILKNSKSVGAKII